MAVSKRLLCCIVTAGTNHRNSNSFSPHDLATYPRILPVHAIHPPGLEGLLGES